MKEFQMPHCSVLINIHEVMTRQIVYTLSVKWSSFPTELK